MRPEFQPPYDGPFPVLSRQEKHFTIQLRRGRVNISIDRLKPAYIEQHHDEDQSTTAVIPTEMIQQQNKKSSTSAQSPATQHSPAFSSSAQPTTTTRSGRTIKLPVRFMTWSLGGVLWRSDRILTARLIQIYHCIELIICSCNHVLTLSYFCTRTLYNFHSLTL